MKGRRVGVWVAVVVVLLLAGVAGWHWWPRHVAPGLTPQMVKVIDSSGNRTITLVDGGSRQDAHTLWSRYHDRPADGAPESPRLLGISLAKLETPSVPGSGTYWVVYLDRVWSRPLGGPGPASYAREVIFVDPDTLHELTRLMF